MQNTNFSPFLKRRGSIRQTIETFLRFDAQFPPGSRFAVNLRKNLRVVKKRATIIWIILITNGVVYLLIPFLRPGRHVPVDSYILFGNKKINNKFKI